ncbi:MAG: M23 family metallopeptidase [bacterium]
MKYSRSFLESQRGVYHVVKKGQTLWSISQAYRVDMKKIVKANGLYDASVIKVGQRLFIPGAGKTKELKKPAGTAKSTRKLKTGKTADIESSTISFIWPVKGKITSPFGTRDNKRHLGIDISAEKGTKIVAAADGTVVYSSGDLGGYGNMIVIEHNSQFSTVYAHNSVNLVNEGTRVKKGQIIAYVGKSGRATDYHLHFEVRQKGKAENPLFYLPR